MFGTGSSLLQQTVQRFLEIIPSKNIFILTHDRYKSQVHNQLNAFIKENQIIC